MFEKITFLVEIRTYEIKIIIYDYLLFLTLCDLLSMTYKNSDTYDLIIIVSSHFSLKDKTFDSLTCTMIFTDCDFIKMS